jgi:hypothetical protein
VVNPAADALPLQCRHEFLRHFLVATAVADEYIGRAGGSASILADFSHDLSHFDWLVAIGWPKKILVMQSSGMQELAHLMS